MGGQGQQAGGQPVDFRRSGEGKAKGFSGIQHVIRELGGQLSQTLLNLVEPILFSPLEAHPRQLGLTNRRFHNALLGGVEAGPVSTGSQLLKGVVEWLTLAQSRGKLHQGRLHLFVGGP